MRLLQLEEDGGFSLVEFFGWYAPPYAILSHTWGPASEEVTFKDLIEGTGKSKPGYRKLTYCRKQTARDNLQYFWVDTCCIDKTSSAELSEAINSMWRWYKNSEVCYAYLIDVPEDTDLEGDDTPFTRSKWFTRGWTLQELLAPGEVVLFNTSWKALGTKRELAGKISTITGIDTHYLGSKSSNLKSASIAERMSWASARNTTREEDIAYCLLGIFDISMPLLYGEGSKAFQRLQEEIMKHSDDQSLFSWSPKSSWSQYARETDMLWYRYKEEISSLSSLLARSPAAFGGCHNVVRSVDASFAKPYSITNRGIQIEFPVIRIKGEMYARLNCRLADNIFRNVAIPILQYGSHDQYQRLYREPKTVPFNDWHRARVRPMYFRLTPETFGSRSEPKDNSCLIRDLPRGFKISQVFPPDAWSPMSKEINLKKETPLASSQRVLVLITSDTSLRFLFILEHRSRAFGDWIPEARVLPNSLCDDGDMATLSLIWQSRHIRCLPRTGLLDSGVIFFQTTPGLIPDKNLTVIDVVVTSNRHYSVYKYTEQVNWSLWSVHQLYRRLVRQLYDSLPTYDHALRIIAVLSAYLILVTRIIVSRLFPSFPARLGINVSSDVLMLVFLSRYGAGKWSRVSTAMAM